MPPADTHVRTRLKLDLSLLLIQMKYVGRLKHSGKIFDQTQGKKTFTFRLGKCSWQDGW